MKAHIMKLSSFIRTNLDEILIEWETFAETLHPTSNFMSSGALCEHGKPILENIAVEIERDQKRKQTYRYALELAEKKNVKSAAALLGAERQENGFTLLQLISEYRLIRTFVLQLWTSVLTRTSIDSVKEILEFNKAIDKSLAESALAFSTQATHITEASSPAVISDVFQQMNQLILQEMYTLSLADLHMNLLTHKVSRGNVAVVLQTREFLLLEFLMRHANQVLTRSAILKHVWGYHFDPHTNFIDVHISKLRKKIDAQSNLKLLRTVRNIGYMLATEES